MRKLLNSEQFNQQMKLKKKNSPNVLMIPTLIPLDETRTQSSNDFSKVNLNTKSK